MMGGPTTPLPSIVPTVADSNEFSPPVVKVADDPCCVEQDAKNEEDASSITTDSSISSSNEPMETCLAEEREDVKNPQLWQEQQQSADMTAQHHKRKNRSVHFHTIATYYPPTTTHTPGAQQDLWVTVGELKAMKRDMDHTACSVLRHKEFRAAMDRLRVLIRGRHLSSSTNQCLYFHPEFHHPETAAAPETAAHKEKSRSAAMGRGRKKTARKQKGASSSMDEGVTAAVVDSCSHLRGEDLARLLIDCDVRGVERLILARLDDVTRQTRPTKLHVNTVLKAQVMFRRKSPHQRAALLSQRCYTQASTEWAQILGRADADAVASEFMLSL